MNRCLLFSGGIDSTSICQSILNTNPTDILHLIHFKYNHQASIAENIAVNRIYKHLNKNNLILKTIDVSSLIPSSDGTANNLFPNRNSIFLNIAIGYCISNKIKDIYYGACLDDIDNYPDCSHQFIDYTNKISMLWGIRIIAPLHNKSKMEINNKLAQNIALKHLTFSCYFPTLKDTWEPCLICSSCMSNS